MNTSIVFGFEISSELNFRKFGNSVARAYLGLFSFSFFFEKDWTTLLACFASIQPRTSLVKFARSPRTDRPGLSTSPSICE